MPANRTFEVKALSRVEGEGALYVKLHGDVVEHVELNIYEPPRFFEAFLRGREIHEKGLRLKKVGNDLLGILGGRAIHPINVTVGGFYKAPSRDRLKKLLP